MVVNEEEEEDNQMHIATKNLKRKRVKAFGTEDELGEFM
jgi:hypothetical protein